MIPTPGSIIEAVAMFYNKTVAEVIGPDRHKSFTEPRHMAMYLIRKKTQLSLHEIGTLLGRSDHTSVLYAVRKIDGLLRQDELLGHRVRLLENRINWADVPPPT